MIHSRTTLITYELSVSISLVRLLSLSRDSKFEMLFVSILLAYAVLIVRSVLSTSRDGVVRAWCPPSYSQGISLWACARCLAVENNHSFLCVVSLQCRWPMKNEKLDPEMV
jgi:hypothetical protein